MKRILIIRLSALGDIVMASGLIPALRRRWPDAHIAWLVEPAGANLLEANPRIDEVIRSPRGEWQRLASAHRYASLARSVAGFARGLRERRFDLVVDAQGLLKSGLAAWLTRAPRRIGLGSREGSARLMTEVLPAHRDDPRMGSEYRRLAEHLGFREQRLPMDITTAPADEDTAERLLRDRGAAGRYAVLCAFTTRPQKHWFDARWRELATELAKRFGLTPVFLGGPHDRDHAERLVAGRPGGAVDLVGALSLRQCAALIRRASALVGVDTGLTHMGTAAAIPTVALFGSTRPYLESDSEATRILYEPLWCSPCRRHPICGGAYSCMRLHRVERVLSELAALLGQDR